MTKKAAQATPNQLLRRARLERGWTQKEVADRIGAPLDLNVTRWERGTAWPSAYYVQKLCELFSKSASELGLLPPQLEATVISQPGPTRSEHELPTGTITLLFAGMEGSTRLLKQVGDRYASVQSECRQVLRAAFEQWNGNVVNTQGDAFFVVFARATDAMSAAVAAWSLPAPPMPCQRQWLHNGPLLVMPSWKVWRCVCAWACTPASRSGLLTATSVWMSTAPLAS
jgi:transcriptional regulator with XRE-family HTH domain